MNYVKGCQTEILTSNPIVITIVIYVNCMSKEQITDEEYGGFQISFLFLISCVSMFAICSPEMLHI